MVLKRDQGLSGAGHNRHTLAYGHAQRGEMEKKSSSEHVQLDHWAVDRQRTHVQLVHFYPRDGSPPDVGSFQLPDISPPLLHGRRPSLSSLSLSLSPGLSVQLRIDRTSTTTHHNTTTKKKHPIRLTMGNHLFFHLELTSLSLPNRPSTSFNPDQ